MGEEFLHLATRQGRPIPAIGGLDSRQYLVSIFPRAKERDRTIQEAMYGACREFPGSHLLFRIRDSEWFARSGSPGAATLVPIYPFIFVQLLSSLSI